MSSTMILENYETDQQNKRFTIEPREGNPFETHVESLHEQARAFMDEHGFAYDGDFPETGEGHQEKFNSEEGRPDKRSWLRACYREKPDGTPGLCITFGRFDGSDTRFTKTFWANSRTWNGLSDEEKSEIKRQREERKREADEKSELEKAKSDIQASKAFDRFSEASTSEPPKDVDSYFSKKGLGHPSDTVSLRWEREEDHSEGVVVTRWIALVALRNGKGQIRGIQELHPEKRIFRGGDNPRNKHFVGKVSGCFAHFGALENGRKILVAEGVATAYTLFTSTNETSIAAMTCGNLSNVVKELRSRYPKSDITICADNDHKTEGNPGLKAARKAAADYGCKLSAPTFPDGEEFDSHGNPRKDFDDLRQLSGPEAVKEQVESAKQIQEEQPEVAEEGKEDDIPEWVSKFNQRHAVVHAGKTYILTEKYDPTLKRGVFSLEPVGSFKSWYKTSRDEKGRELSTQWISNPHRREYPGGIIFDPEKPGHYGGFYNLFRGFEVVPKKGECGLFWEMLLVDLCGGNESYAIYIRRWLAHMIQRPWELPEVALGFRGEGGTGKGTFMRFVSRLVSPHYLELAQMSQVAGRFNSHMKDVLLVYANEAVWGGHKTEVGALKAMITDPLQAIEQKGVDIITVRNCKRLVLTSNEDWIVPMDIDDRRFLISDVSTVHKEDKQYFAAIHQQMESGGLEALMHDLYHEDITGWHPRNTVPVSTGAFDLKLKGMRSSQRWLYHTLENEQISLRDDGVSRSSWPPNNTFSLSKDVVFQDYRQFCESRRIAPDDDATFWKGVKSILGDLQESRGPRSESGARPRRVELPSLADGRRAFARYSKTPLEVLGWND